MLQRAIIDGRLDSQCHPSHLLARRTRSSMFEKSDVAVVQAPAGDCILPSLAQRAQAPSVPQATRALPTCIAPRFPRPPSQSRWPSGTDQDDSQTAQPTHFAAERNRNSNRSGNATRSIWEGRGRLRFTLVVASACDFTLESAGTCFRG